MKRIQAKTFLTAAVVIFTARFAFAQVQALPAIQARLDSLETQYQLVQLQQKQLSERAGDLAEIINRLKTRRAKNLITERELERQLALSQALAERHQAAQQREAWLHNELMRFSEAVIKNLNNAIHSLGDSLRVAQAKRDDAGQRRSSANLQLATRLRNRCLAYLNTAPGAIPVVEIQLEPDDSPRQIAQKSDFMLDQSDRLKKAAGSIDKKLGEMKGEIELRRRLADFVGDLAAFDPRSESISGSIQRSENAVAATRDQANIPDSDEKARFGQISSDLSLSQIILNFETNWPANTAQLSSDELEEWIGQLERQQKQLLSTADSLAQKAREFRKILESKKE
jgi:hypothetical protein